MGKAWLMCLSIMGQNTISSGLFFKKMVNAGLGEIRISGLKEISPMGEIPLEVGRPCGTIRLLGNGALTHMAG